MNRLDPRVTWIWRLGGLTIAVILTLGVAALESFVLLPRGLAPVGPFRLTAAVLVFALTFGLAWPSLRYRAWGWRVEPDRVLIRKGVLWRTRSLVPRVRIQHVDTRSSPLQRWLGLNTLTIYTAGTRGADVSIPGLEAREAEALREELARLEEVETDG